jgi:signal transduction histidine kinase/DNA-binding LacI/PurR family transcriptional regulator/AraC-like DNA-binding protein/ActR/RegA family two-component response regulator
MSTHIGARLSIYPNGGYRSTRPTFGFIVTWGFTNPYSSPMWWGAVDAAKKLDVNVVGFGDINIYYPERNRSLYAMINSGRLDGVILLHPSYPQLPQSVFNSVPIVNIGCSGECFVTSILVDNHDGMRAAVRHMIEIHGCQRPAFIKGPVNNPDSDARFQAYIDELQAHNLTLDDDLLYQPFDWSPPGGQECVRVLLDNRKVQFDAVIASNDNMALAAMEELQARGLRVPYDVIVCGFDDAVESITSTPPLTTVRQPLHEMGQLAVEVLSANYRGNSVPKEFVLPVSLMVRRSCGCLSESVLSVSKGLPVGNFYNKITSIEKNIDAGALLQARREILLSEMQRAIVRSEISSASFTAEAWVKALILDFDKGSNGENFLTAIDLTSRLLMEQGHPIAELQNVLSAMRRESCLALAGQPALLAQAENIWHRARVFLNELVLQQQRQKLAQLNNQMAVVRSISQALAVTFHLNNLIDVLIHGLKQLGIESCYISLYEGTDRPAEQAKVIMAYSRGQRLKIRRTQNNKIYPVAQMLPAKLWSEKCNTLILEALEFQSEEIGFVLFEPGPHEAAVYEAVRSQLGSSVKGALLFDERDNLLVRTTELYEQASEGRRMAEEANRLKSRFLSLVSHELRTPLSMISGLSELMLWDANSQKPINLENLERLHSTAQHLDGLIRDVLDLAKDEMGELKLAYEPLDLTKILEAVVLVGEQMARERDLKWQAQIPSELPLVWGDRTRLRQVVWNLVNNAIKFTEKGKVSLKVTTSPEGITVSVSDTGLGIPPAEQEIIFEEFRQSDRTSARGYGGLGLGLAICKRLVEMHGGKISVCSSGVEGGGATFSFTLPTMQAVTMVGKASIAIWIVTTRPDKTEQLKQYLEEQGFKAEILLWDDKDRWLARIIQSSPEAIVLDVHETPERGWDAMRALKAHPATSEATVLFYVLNSENNSGAILELDYLTKPIGAPDLAQALWRVGWAENDAAAGGAIPSNKTILIVDDDPGVLDMHAQIVRSQFPQYQILLAAGGKEALLLLQTGKPDLVLLDLMMPELDGFGVLEAMQKMESACNIPVIVLTARTLAGEEMTRLNRSVAAVLSKGVFSTAETLIHIQEVLSHRKKLNNQVQRLTRKAMAYIHEHYSEPIGREDIARCVGVSEGYLSRSFINETGLSLIHYLTRYRIQQAKQLLVTSHKSVTEIAMEIGFSDSNYFSRVFRQEVGVSPLIYRQKK